MGWAFNNCSVKSQKPINQLIIEFSDTNNSAASSISSFIQYLKRKNIDAIVSTVSNRDLNDLIVIKYYSCNTQELIFKGNNLEEKNFDSLYAKITSS